MWQSFSHTLLLGVLVAVTVGLLAYRWLTRGEKGGHTLDVFAGEA